MLLKRIRQVRREIRQTYHMVASLSEQQRQTVGIDHLESTPSTWVPPGHFYSPLVDPVELAAHRATVFDRQAPLPGIDLRVTEQLAMVERLARHYPELPFTEIPAKNLRYHYGNPAFGHGDAIVLGCMLAELRPARLVEFGSGYSSCATLDVAERLLDGRLNCTFVDPFPALLQSLLGSLDSQRHSIVKSRAQDIALDVVDVLQAGDVLFVDSTHVSKAGSDVNFHLFTILPRLQSGVYIHFHDIFFPFEYPQEWFFEENRSWNEIYLLRAFLMNNPGYEIVVFNDYLGREHATVMEELMPLFMRNPGGSLWLRKL